MRLRLIAPLAALALSAPLLHATDAGACGGCFHPPVISQGESTVVTGHRMAFATSPTQTVLWDQIRYSGDPKEFAWVLPVRKGAVVEESTDAWFETLEAATATQVNSPILECPEITRPQQGCAGGALSGGASFDGQNGAGGGSGTAPPPVTVVHEGTVGAYETVTLSTTTPGALNTWLTDHGYNVDDDIQPIIDAYVAEGFDFIALRLLPGKDVRAMKPVRVVSPGASLTLPLRMVAAGTGADVAITLYTITEGRLEADKYLNTVVNEDDLVWDFSTSSSNFSEVRTSTLAQNGGLTWITSYAQRGALLSPFGQSYGGEFGDYYGYSDTLATAYVNQGAANGETQDVSCLDGIDRITGSNALVVDPCPAGVPYNDPSCGEVAPGQTDARTLACGKLDDLVAAFTGMHPSDVWVTRIEADLPRLALANDLVLKPGASQSPVSNTLDAPVGINEDGLCPSSVPPLSMISRGYGKAAGSGRKLDPTSMFGYAVMGLIVAGAVARRRRK